MPNTASAQWEGNLKEGRGHFNTGSLEGGYTFKSRFEGENDVSANPEQLIAAAHASCFSMALSNTWPSTATSRSSIKTTVEVTVKIVDGDADHQQGRDQTVGKVQGIDAEHFAEHAEEAKEGLPCRARWPASARSPWRPSFEG